MNDDRGDTFFYRALRSQQNTTSMLIALLNPIFTSTPATSLKLLLSSANMNYEGLSCLELAIQCGTLSALKDSIAAAAIMANKKPETFVAYVDQEIERNGMANGLSSSNKY